MGDVLQLAEARRLRTRSRGAGRGTADAPVSPPRGFEAVECGSGWYHGEAVQEARKPPEPR